MPQIFAISALLGYHAPHGPSLPSMIAAIYPLAILSFLGGTWWGLAMRSEASQSLATCLAIVPGLSAVGLAFGFLFAADIDLLGWCFAETGSAIMLTLPVDRWLMRVELTPEGSMALRVPLSLGLGGLTIIAGVLVGS